LGVDYTEKNIECQIRDGRGQKAGREPLYGEVPALPPDFVREVEYVRSRGSAQSIAEEVTDVGLIEGALRTITVNALLC
jgi:hypothetical protein